MYEDEKMRRRTLRARAGLVLVTTCLPAMLCAQGDCFVRGDANTDGNVDMSDGVFTLAALFQSGPASTCRDAQDADDSGRVDIQDAIFTLNVTFYDIGTIPPPFPGCGVDASADLLDCVRTVCPGGNAATALSDRVFTLATGRVGLRYRGSLPACFQEELLLRSASGPATVLRPAIRFVNYLALDACALPPGLSIDESTGIVSGEPRSAGTSMFLVRATTPAGTIQTIRAQIDVFSRSESEIVADQRPEATGLAAVRVFDSSFVFAHDFETHVVESIKPVRIYYPGAMSRPAPILVFHHGFGFTELDYESLLRHLASHGVIAVTVADAYSWAWSLFTGGSGEAESARVMLRARDHVVELARRGGVPFAGQVDSSRTFYAGHSRGGGGALFAADFDPLTAGIIALQPTDPRDDFALATSDLERLANVPVLIVTAEQETDTRYPLAERLLERVRGAATMVTIYGGCHGYTTDSSNNACRECAYEQRDSSVDECPYIARPLQHTLTKKFVTAFVRRHGFGDVSLEGLLYGAEFQRSPLASVASRRNLGSALVVDDFSAFPLNAMGLSTAWTASGVANVRLGSCYDVPTAITPADFPPITNLLLTLPSAGTLNYRSTLGTSFNALAVGARKKLLLRVKNADRLRLVDNSGFGWLDSAVTLRDAAGRSASLSMNERLPTTRFHPEPRSPGAQALLKYQRFITLAVPLADFTAVNPGLDLERLVALEWRFVTNGTSTVTPILGFDDLRFE